MAAFERDAVTQRVIEELKRLYKTKILPLEQTYRYDVFFSPYMTDAEFDSKPQVMLIGQYSVGKTTFIRYLLGRDFPGQRIGPEPTTDRFSAVMDGPEDRIIPGNALAVSAEQPFRGLERFGVAFLNRFEGAQLSSQVLRNITLIDTPGVLSGEKQRVARGYDFNVVCGWFAGRADLILLLFDAHKLDISDEFRNVIESLKGNDDKIRCILNKADQIDRQKLMRVYGALMWSLGKVVKTPEVLRVYVGSFWNEPLRYEDNKELFEMEQRDLMNDLKGLPRNSALRKINELCKRVRTAKVHAYIISHLKEQMPMMMGHAKKQKQLIEELPKQFRSVMKKYNLAAGDFPEIDDYRSKLQEMEFSKFHSLKLRLLEDVEVALSIEIPRLLEALPRAPSTAVEEAVPAGPLVYEQSFRGNNSSSSSNWATGADDDTNPFGDDNEWVLSEYVDTYRPMFSSSQSGGFITGAAAKNILLQSKIPKTDLKKIWDLSDVDKDGQLSLHEFVLAMYLTELAKQGQPLPAQLEPSMIPPQN